MSIHEYETIFITRPELDEAENQRLHEKLKGAIERYDGTILIEEAWGRRKLAYPIAKHHYGDFLYLDYTGSADLPAELERLVRIEFNLIRFLTVRLGVNVDPETCLAASQDRQHKRAERALEHDERRRERSRREERNARRVREAESERASKPAPKPAPPPTSA